MFSYSFQSKLLVEMMEEDKIKGLAEFALKINEKQELTHIFCIAKKWKETYDLFNDIIIMDCTMGKNRF